MNKQQNPSGRGGKHPNDPSKNDPTKQDERDNDATRIRPSNEKKEEPETPPGGGKAPGNKGVEEPRSGKPYEREPKHKPEPVEEPNKQEGNSINKGDHNPAAPVNRQNESSEKDDQGNPVMRGYGKGL